MGYNETRDPHKGAIMNAAKNTLARSRKFVSDHKVAIAVVATATACTVVRLKVIRNTNARLTEMGISLDEFYKSEV
jgi:hypothetical protein